MRTLCRQEERSDRAPFRRADLGDARPDAIHIARSKPIVTEQHALRANFGSRRASPLNDVRLQSNGSAGKLRVMASPHELWEQALGDVALALGAIDLDVDAIAENLRAAAVGDRVVDATTIEAVLDLARVVKIFGRALEVLGVAVFHGADTDIERRTREHPRGVID
jgi:hypothetical protein